MNKNTNNNLDDKDFGFLDTSIKEMCQEEILGKWIEVDTNMYSCNKCNNCFTLVPEDNNISQYNFCPKCGAKMGGTECN